MLTRVHAAAILVSMSACIGTAHADDASVNDRVRALEETVARQARVIEQLQSKSVVGENWLNEKRATEVRALIQEVLADADTRASLMFDGMAAGYAEHGFFVGSPDGQYVLNIGALIQTRYIYNNRSNDFEDENVAGFDLPRAEIFVGGVAYDWGYNVRVSNESEDGQVFIKSAFISRDISDALSIKLGGFRDNFTYEEQIESSNQLAVERSLVNEAFTNDHVLGLQIGYDLSNVLQISGGFHNGARSFSEDADGFDNDTDYAVTGRVDWRIMGDRDKWADFSSWSGEATRLRIGGGVAYDVAETGNADDNDKELKWTADASFESNGLGLFGAVYGSNTDREAGDDQDRLGLVLQGGYFLIPDRLEAFARYEYMDLDGGAAGTLEDDEVNILTVGLNYYCQQHFAKFTADFLYSFDSVPGAADLGNPSADLGLFGLLPDADDEDGQYALRLQMQLNF